MMLRLGARGIAAAVVGRNKASHASAECGLDEAQVLRDIFEGERGDDSILALAGGRELIERQIRRDGDGPHGGVRWRRGRGGASQHGDVEASGLGEALENNAANGTVCADQQDLGDGARG